MVAVLHSNFEWKHSNLRLRLYLWSKIIEKHNMIAKMLNLLLLFNIFYHDATVFQKVPLTLLLSVTKCHEKHWDQPTAVT